MEHAKVTIGRLARAAGVHVETVRYYQQRGLVPVPATEGPYRLYPLDWVGRLRFIKRAQSMGLSLDEVGKLLGAQDATARA